MKATTRVTIEVTPYCELVVCNGGLGIALSQSQSQSQSQSLQMRHVRHSADKAGCAAGYEAGYTASAW